jgi:hypothetical protein
MISSRQAGRQASGADDDHMQIDDGACMVSIYDSSHPIR